MRTLLFVALVSCSAPTRPPPLSSRPPSPPAPVDVPGGAVAFTGSTPVHPTSLFFTDGGDLVVTSGDYFVVIDPVTRKQIGDIGLSSGHIPDPHSRPGVSQVLSWSTLQGVWAWDPGARSVIGAVVLGTWGDALTGLAVWRPARALPVAVPAKARWNCEPLAISRDRKLFAARVATAQDFCDIGASSFQVFSVENSEPVTAPIEAGWAQQAAFSPDGRYVAAGRAVVYVHDLSSQRTVTVQPANHIQAIAFHPTQPIVAWTTIDRVLETWRIGDPAPVRRGMGHGVAFSPDGRYVATLDMDPKLLDATTFEPVAKRLTGVRDSMCPDAIAFSDDSRQLAIAASMGGIGVWQLEPPAPRTETGWLARLRPLPIPPPRPFPRIDRDGALDGRVLVGGKAVGNATVTLEPHPQEYDDARALPKLSARTGPDGRYHFDHVPTILWQQLVVVPGATIGGYLFDMRREKVHHADVALQPAATIVGSVVGPDNRPATDVRIFHPASPGGGDGGEVDVATDRNGRFTIDHLRPIPDAYLITARRADGAVIGRVVSIEKPGRIRVALKLARPTDPSVLHVLVVDKDGAPVANARVSAELEWGVTGPDGKTSIHVDTARTYPKGLNVRANNEAGVAVSDTLVVDLPHPAPLTLRIDR